VNIAHCPFKPCTVSIIYIGMSSVTHIVEMFVFLYVTWQPLKAFKSFENINLKTHAVETQISSVLDIKIIIA
jgi:uncharacterized membrane protein YwzB